jgi:F0F1-type ATP synthase assembly protein I
MPEDSKRRDDQNPLVSLSRYSEIGFVIPIAIVLGYALGKLIDHWLHTHWLYLAGVIFGAVAGFIEMIRMAWALTRDKP